MSAKVVSMIGGLCLAVLTGCAIPVYQQDRSSTDNWTVDEPREMVMIPDSQVYFVPNVSFDLFFYNNSWWSQRQNNWYRSRSYNGPWENVHQRYVPAPVYRVPRDYRSVYGREQHIPYGQLKRPGNDSRQDDRQDNRNRRGRGN